MIDRDTTIRLAREVGAVSEVIAMGRHSGILFTPHELEHFAALVAALIAAAEREACAQLCDIRETMFKGYKTDGLAALCAAAIRARSKT